jgi:hypothetical protein
MPGVGRKATSRTRSLSEQQQTHGESRAVAHEPNWSSISALNLGEFRFEDRHHHVVVP